MKRNGVAARIAAAILAVGMIMTDTVPALATEATKEVTQETTQGVTEASVEQDINGSVNGVSKVIGLDGTPDVYTISSDDRTVCKKYTYTNWDECNASVYAFGTAKDYLDSYTGFYKVGNDLYASATEQSASIVKFTNKLAWYGAVEAGASSDGIKPTKNADGIYVVNGKYYKNYNTKSIKETDAQGNSKTVRTIYSVYPQEELVKYMDLSEEVGGSENLFKPMERLCGRKLASTDELYSYYEANGKYYTNGLVCHLKNNGNYTVKAIYFYKKREITFDSCYHKISWRKVTNDTEVDSNGKVLNIGYQVRVNGEIVALNDFVTNGDEVQPMTTSNSYRYPVLKMAGEAANYEVRAVYYTADETVTRDAQTQEEVVTVTNHLVKTGEWSEVYSYAWAGVTQS